MPNIFNLIIFYLVIIIALKMSFNVTRLFLNNRIKKSFIMTNIECFFVILAFVLYNTERKFKIDIIKKNFDLFSVIKSLFFICIFSISFYFVAKFINNLHMRAKKRTIISILVILLILIFVEIKIRFKVSESKQILLVSIDSLRPDHLSCYGYTNIHTKNIDDLAKNSFLFKNVYCQAPYTAASLASISSGYYPFHTDVRNFDMNFNPELKNIGEILLENNYDCVMIGGPLYKSRNFSRGGRTIDISSISFAEFVVYRISNLFRKKQIKDRTISALSYINNNLGKSYFMWIHYWDPHAPYHPPKAYINSKTNFKVNVTGTVEQLKNFAKNNELYSENDLKHLINLYDSEVLFIDDNIGLLAKKFLEKSGNYTYIITADHGEALGENGLFLHGIELIEPMIRIPLIVNCSWLNKKPGKINQMVSSIDIVPTILDLLKINKENFNFDGKSLLPLIEGNYKDYMKVSYFETMGAKKIGISNGKYKLIYNVKNKEKKIYLLTQKGKEKLTRNNLILEELEKKLLDLMNISKLEDLRIFKNKKINEKLKKDLRSLGYIN